MLQSNFKRGFKDCTDFVHYFVLYFNDTNNELLSGDETLGSKDGVRNLADNVGS